MAEAACLSGMQPFYRFMLDDAFDELRQIQRQRYFMALPHFTIYSRSYCHLCDDMLQALKLLEGEYRFTVDMIDVDADEALVALYDELVPVLFGRHQNGEPVRLCHYFLDQESVRSFLATS